MSRGRPAVHWGRPPGDASPARLVCMDEPLVGAADSKGAPRPRGSRILDHVLCDLGGCRGVLLLSFGSGTPRPHRRRRAIGIRRYDRLQALYARAGPRGRSHSRTGDVSMPALIAGRRCDGRNALEMQSERLGSQLGVKTANPELFSFASFGTTSLVPTICSARSCTLHSPSMPRGLSLRRARPPQMRSF